VRDVNHGVARNDGGLDHAEAVLHELTLVQMELPVSKIEHTIESHVNEVTVLARNVTDVQTEEGRCCLQPCAKA
jgi:hypothetical protein